MKAFLAGMMIGFGAYALYLKFLTSNQDVANAIGWIFFTPQHLVFWTFPNSAYPGTVATVVSFAVISLCYGYITLSFALSPKAGIVTFSISSLLFLLFVHWFKILISFSMVDAVTRFIFWPAYLLKITFDDAGVFNHFIRTLVECLAVSFWYASLICCVRAIPVLCRKRSSNVSPSDASADTDHLMIACVNCNQMLRVPAAPDGVLVRCPTCQFKFNTHRG